MKRKHNQSKPLLFRARKILLFVSMWLLACSSSEQNHNDLKQASTNGKIALFKFTDVTRQAGIDFVHYNGAYGKKYFPEMAGSGCGFLDYDSDGWLDILLVNGKNWPSHPGKTEPTLALYRNRGDGTFEDVTKQVGLAVPIYGMGMAAADYDNDGDTDLLITAVGPNKFFRNDGGKFTDITEQAGVGDPAWSTSAMFFDYDKDGFLDLYVCNYVKWSEETDLWCTLDGKTKAYCTPEIYTGEPSRLYHNRGDGTFEDVTVSSGVYNEEGKSLGVALLDFNDDGWPDFAVANDTQPDFLYRNNGPGPNGKVTFSEIGLISGMALDESGKARAGMGIDVGVVDETGEETIFVGNFSNEMIGVYRDLGHGSYIDRAAISQVGNASLLYLTFGLFLFDYDYDFDLDLFAVNGHVQPEIEEVQQAVTFKQPCLFYNNLGNGRFEEIGHKIGEPFTIPIVGRGAVYGDYDRDGDLDILVSVNNGPPMLLRNEAIPQQREQLGNYLRVRLQGTKSNRDGIGAKVVAKLGNKTLPQYVKTGSTYLSQNELTLTFGLGDRKQLDELTVYWPSGIVDSLQNIQGGQEIVIREGSGIIK
ncbi:MAG: CRTAC1 family protein [Calditrichaeota bacterium]|nr:MAG: CRTAC1 family protein [Calditrichota bacterium]